MPLTERERSTQSLYELNARSWLEYSGGKNRECFWPEGLSAFKTLLPENARILEVGCGPATDGKYLTGMGYSVISSDYANSMMNLAKELNPEGRYLLADTQQLSFPDSSFDGFWATASLLHLENPTQALMELARVTKNAGVGFISIKEGKGESTDPRTGYYYKYYSPKEFGNILYENNFEILNDGRKAGTSNHDWLTYLIRVRK